MKKRNLKDRITLDPIMTLLVLIVLTIVVSGFLSLLGVQVTYNSITDNITTKGRSPIILESKQISTNAKVTFFFLAFLVKRVTTVFKNPLFSITPIPIKIIIKLDKGLKDTKLETVVVKIYLRPLKLNKDSTEIKL